MTEGRLDSSARGRVVAVVPARGGSKGIPGKNLRPVGGVPLVARAVTSLLGCRFVDRTIVSTDDDAIAAVALAAGADVVDRPEHLSGDHASSESAVLHALDVLEPDPSIVLLVQPTSPFIDPRDVDSAISRVVNGECDVVFSAIETHAFLWRMTSFGAAGVNHGATSRPMRQDRPAQYQETGAFYVMRAAGLREAGFRFFGHVGIGIVNERTALEIDTHEHLGLARVIATALEGDRRSPEPRGRGRRPAGHVIQPVEPVTQPAGSVIEQEQWS